MQAMKTRVLVGSVICGMSLMISPVWGQLPPAVEKQIVADGEGFQLSPVPKASEIVPAALVKDAHYSVDEFVLTRGFENQYTLTSDYGPLSAYGDTMLRIRIQEIHALTAMAGMKKTQKFADALVQAGKSPFKGAGNLILHPIDTVTGVPKGAWRYMTRIGRLVRGQRGETEESGLKELIGFGGAKRRLANELGVDVYSTNKILQKQMNSLAWAAYAGGMTFQVGTMGIGAASKAAQLVIMGTSKVNSLNKILLDQSAEDVRNLNTKTLKKMGIHDADAKRLITHPWYSPRQQLYLVESLAGLKSAKNRGAFVKLALTASSTEEAFFFQRIAMLLLGYNDQVAPLAEVRVVNGLATGFTGTGDMVVPLVLDVGVWSEQATVLIDAVNYAAKDREVKKVQIYVTGRLSTMAVEELQGKGWEVTQDAWSTLYPQG